MSNPEQSCPEQFRLAASALALARTEFAPFDLALHTAAVAVAAAEHVPAETPLMAAGWWSAVVAPEDPCALELRHLPNLPAGDAIRVRELFAEVAEIVDAGGGCEGDAWEVLTLWELGSSLAATAAANAVMILVCRAVEADAAAGYPGMPPEIRGGIPARVRDLLEE